MTATGPPDVTRRRIYLETMQELQLDVTSEFLVMAATLIYLKSKLLVPPDDLPERVPETLDVEPAGHPVREGEVVRGVVVAQRTDGVHPPLRGRRRGLDEPGGSGGRGRSVSRRSERNAL